MIADAQVHTWGPHTAEKPITGKTQRLEPLTPEALLSEMDAVGVHRAVIIPPRWQDCTDLALDAAARVPDRLAVVGRLNLKAPDAKGRLAELRSTPGMMGIRLSQHETVANDGSMDAVLNAAQEHGVRFMINSVSSSPHSQPVDYMAERFPELKIAIDHCGLEQHARDDEAFAAIDKLLALARFPNVSVKATSLPSYSADPYPYRRLHPHIRRIYDAFGPKRIFWGSDLSRLPCSYQQCVTMFTDELPWLSGSDKEWIMGRALCEWLGWEVH